MKISKKIAIFFCFLAGVIAGNVHAQSPGHAVTPLQLFPSDILNIYSPNSEGWLITGMGRNGISFGKKGAENNETYGAQVIVFEMPPFENEGEFISFVKKRIAAMNPFPRFLETNSSYQTIENRGYPCVNANIDFDDTAAVTPAGTQLLKLKVVSLYCRHPVESQLGFFAAYSYRGNSSTNSIEDAAQNFIENIRVPEK